MAAASCVSGTVGRAGRYVIFVLADEEYGIDVANVREIIGPLPITRVPSMPDWVRGVINLRGRVIPVIDLRIRFGLPAVDHGERTCIVVVRTASAEFGAVVDQVAEVAAIGEAEIEDAPTFGTGIETAYLLGLAKHGTRVRLLLDIERTLTQREVAALVQAVEPARP